VNNFRLTDRSTSIHTTYHPESIIVANLNDGTAFLGTRVINGSNRIDIEAFPFSNNCHEEGFDSTSDGYQLFANALIWSASGRCNSDDCFACATKNCSWCLDNNTCGSRTSNCRNRIINPSFCPINCAVQKTCDKCLTHSTKCQWCLDNNSCGSTTSPCENYINDKEFCPNKLKK